MVSQVRVRCTRCGTVALRYNYGKGRGKWRRFGKSKSKGNPMVWNESHAKITDSCILCRGAVEAV